jgi:hypothetical protein
MAIACMTIFFHAGADELAARYQAAADRPCGYLTRVGERWIFTEATATETADWERQLELAAAMTDEGVVGISVLLVGAHWALAVARDGRAGPMAVCVPDNEEQARALPRQLSAVEQALVELFPDEIDAERVDELFGAVLEGATPIDEAVTEILGMLGCSAEWPRWSWYETIPEQLFIDPDLAERVVPIGDACQLWEE